MEKCKICEKDFKKLTANHLKTHNITRLDYLEMFDKDKYKIERELYFITHFYLTVRYRFLEYKKDQVYTIDIYKNQNHNDTVISKILNDKELNKNDTFRRTFHLNSKDIRDHLGGNKVIGIYTPANVSNFLSFDIDVNDSNILTALYEYLLEIGIKDENMLASYSGNKGFHLDIFFNDFIDKRILTTFYKQALDYISFTLKKHIENTNKKAEDIVECRGANNQALKLPLGYHNKTKNFCYMCNEFGEEMTDYLIRLKMKQKLDTSVILNAIELDVDFDFNANYSNTIALNDIEKVEDLYDLDTNNSLNKQDKKQFKEIFNQVETLAIYENTNEKRIETVEKTIEKGIHERGYRNKFLLELGTYLKDVKHYCLKEALDFTYNFAAEKCANVYDEEFKHMIKSTYKTIYEKNYNFFVKAKTVTFSLPELKEVLSIKTNNKLQTKALQRLYFSMIIHAKAYADENSDFFMTYDQMIEAGATKDRGLLYKQIRTLESLEKIIIVSANVLNEEKTKKNANVYRLTQIKTLSKKENVKQFTLCNKSDKCKNCIDIITCKLLSNRERQKVIVNKDYRDIKKLIQDCEGKVI